MSHTTPTTGTTLSMVVTRVKKVPSPLSKTYKRVAQQRIAQQTKVEQSKWSDDEEMMDMEL